MKALLYIVAAVAAFGQAQTPLKVHQGGATAGQLWLQEPRAGGTDWLKLRAGTLAADVTFTLPTADGTTGQCLSTDGAGVLSFAACAGYWTLSGSDIYRDTGIVTIGHDTPTVRLGQNLNTNYAGNFGGIAMNVFSATGGHGAVLDFNKSANGTLGAHSAVSSNDMLGFLVFRGSDGTDYQRAAQVTGTVDGTVSSGVVPGRIEFLTATTGGTMTERWRIGADGHFRPGADDTYDIGLTGTRARAVYAKFGEFYKSGSTASSDYLTTRKYNILDQSGGSGAWDIQASGSMASTSSIKIRDNAGSRWLEGWRALSGSPLNFTSVFSSWIPAKRATADGDAVNDTPFPDLGASSARWANIYGAAMDLSGAANITGNLSAAVINATGSPAYRVSGTTVIDASRNASFVAGTFTGNVGIGGASSGATLHLLGGSGANYIMVQDSTAANTAIFYVDSTSTSFGNNANVPLYFQTDTTPRWLISNSGMFLPYLGNTYDLGSTGARVRKVWAVDIDMSGTCTGCGSSGLPVTDTTGIAKGSSDATKIARLEVDGLTTATTRVMTVPDANFTIAGLSIAQTFSALQTFSSGFTAAANSSITGAFSLLMDRATRTTNQKAYWTVAGNASTTGAWSTGTTPGGGQSRWVIDHNGTEIITVDEAGLVSLSAGLGITGAASAATINATGSPAYRVSGTTVIDASRNATFVNLTASGSINLSGTVASDILFGSANTYIVGNSTNYLNAIHANNVVAYASFLPASGVSTVDVGSSTRRVRNTYTLNLDITGTVTPPSGTALNGTTSCSAGQAVKSITFSQGIATAITCGTP